MASIIYYRVCPGKAFADTTLWLTAVNIIATMDLTFAKDATGRNIVPEAGFLSGFIRCGSHNGAAAKLLSSSIS